MAQEEIKKILREYADETKRHFDVVIEGAKGEIKIVAEQVAANTEKLEEHDQRFDAIDQRFDKIEDTLEVIKGDISLIKNELTQKVSRDEFIVLEKRLSLLETKVRQAG